MTDLERQIAVTEGLTLALDIYRHVPVITEYARELERTIKSRAAKHRAALRIVQAVEDAARPDPRRWNGIRKAEGAET